MHNYILGAVLALISVALFGCGSGGGGGTGGGPTPSPSGKHGNETMDCPKEGLRAHCTGKCIKNWDTDEIYCNECKAPYKLDPVAMTCVIKCSEYLPNPKPRPEMPANARDLDGVEWPEVCFDQEDEITFFTIGDWGGVCSWPNFDHSDPTKNLCNEPQGSAHWRPYGVIPGKPFPMDTYKRTNYVDANGQVLVADKMMHMYKNLSDLGQPPRFVINVGDSFYPGGIEEHCSNKNGDNLAAILKQYQFKAVFEDVYTSDDPEFNKLEWWSVLGNHDYGGNCYIKAWDQIVFYTWKPESRWVLPAPYWKRHVQFKRFDADFFFIDTNVLDTEPPSGNPKQNICFGAGNTDQDNPLNHCHFKDYPPDGFSGESCPKTNGPMNPDDCVQWFKDLWNKVHNWLDAELAKSTADWQIVVHHYPVKNHPPGLDWKEFSDKHGIDLILTGHQHFQKIYYDSPIDDMPSLNLGKTTHVISGGGGGIQTDLAPNPSANDDSYGYMVMKLSVDKLEVMAYTHGGKLIKDGGKQVLRNHTVATYRETAAQEQVIAGLETKVVV